MINKKRYFTIILFLLPALTIYLILVIYPVTQSVYLSLFEWNGIPSVALKYVGLQNYIDMFTNKKFWGALKNSGWFILTSFLVQLPLSFLLASIISSKIKGLRFFKTSFFMPVILPITAIGIIWVNILYPNGGVLNSLLRILGLGNLETNWLGNSSTAIIVTALVSCWVYAGLNMIIISAGMAAIPEDIYESGKLDGATGFKKTIYITIPMLAETLKIYSILAITGALKVFDIIYVMTKGGPNNASETLAMLLYNESFKYSNFGYGSSLGTFILVASIIISIGLNKFFYRENY